MATIRFLGAAGTVTGSMYLVTTDAARVLVDCGLFQGPRDLKARNWGRLPKGEPPVDAVVLTHAHLDHAGYLPRFVKDGFAGRAFCTPATADLLGILLPDAGFLQEEEAQHANRKGWSRHQPARPLYTAFDAQRALRVLRPVPYGEARAIALGIQATFQPAGHILGSAIVALTIDEAGRRTRVVFSGDLGRRHAPLMPEPAPLPAADYVVVESTYGDRLHPATPPEPELARVVREAAARGGMLVVPAFAVGRTQELLYVLRELEEAAAIPELDVFLDSPMALDATDLTLAHRGELDAETAAVIASGRRPLAPRRLHYVRDAAQSRALNAIRGPGIILSASGMCTGGRIKHHLRVRLPDARNTICFVGFQAAGTRGRALAEGAKAVWIFGEQVPVRAAVTQVEGFSAHADRDQLLDWLASAPAAPRLALVVHGEPPAAQALAAGIEARLGWRAAIPALDEAIVLHGHGAAPAGEPVSREP